MSLAVCVLGSGSSGNCTYVAGGNTRVLIDAGLSGKETARRLACVNVDISSIQAICLTHEHDDHTAGLGVLHRRLGVPVYANSGTIEAVKRNESLRGISWRVFSTGSPFQFQDLTVEPFSVPHDAYDPVGFALRCGEASIGVVTDMGMATNLIRERLRSCRAVVVESNHDEQMLRDADRPWSLKQRIAGRQGHMSNQGAAELLVQIADPLLECAFLAHLSSDCNTPELALKTSQRELKKKGLMRVCVKLTHPDAVSEMIVCS